MKMRFCAQCKLHVVKAAEMTDEEVLAALQKAMQGEEVCMKIYRRADGTFLTKDCPVGLQLLRERAEQAMKQTHQAARRAAAWLSGALTLALSCAATGAPGGQNKASGSKPGAPSTECGAKPTWHSSITADSPATAHHDNKGSSVNQNPRPPRYSGEMMGKVAVASNEQIANQEKQVAASRQNTRQLTAELEILAGMLRYKAEPAKSVATHSQLLKIYEANNDFARASASCVELANVYANGLCDQQKASEYRLKSDQYYLKSSPQYAKRDADAVARIAKYDRDKAWGDAKHLCADLADASGSDRERGNHWIRRAQQYAIYMVRQ
jgi:hypothetical protein